MNATNTTREPVVLPVLTWAEQFDTDVFRWLLPYRHVYAARGYDTDDTAQEARLVLLKQAPYLDKLYVKVFGRHEGVLMGSPGLEAHTAVKAAARKLVMRTVRRTLLGRAKEENTPVFDVGPLGWDMTHEAEGEEHRGEIALEMVEIVDAAPADVAAYLRLVLTQTEEQRETFDWNTADAMDGIKTRASRFVLDWIVQHHSWSHES